MIVYIKYLQTTFDKENIPQTRTFVRLRHVFRPKMAKRIRRSGLVNNYLVDEYLIERVTKMKDCEVLWFRVLTREERMEMRDPLYQKGSILDKILKEDKLFLYTDIGSDSSSD